MVLAGARRTSAVGPRERRAGRGALPVLLGVAVVAAGCVALAAGGCVKVEPFACTSTSACVRAGEPGTCEPTGWCSFPDPSCASGWRYGAGAGGGLADACVEGSRPPADGGQDAAPDAGGDAEPVDAKVDTTPCSEGALSCDGDNLTRCSQGVPEVAATCVMGCLALGSDARCYTFSPHNVAEATLTAGTYEWVITTSTDVTTAGANVPAAVGRTTATQAGGARDLVILTVRSLWVKPSVILRFTGTMAVVIVASDHILVEGVIDVSGSGTTAGPGGWRGGNAANDGSAPTGATGAPAGATSGNGEDTGGSGGCFGAVGGSGGPAGSAAGPGPGTVFGTTSLAPLFGGGGGGGGGGWAGGGEGGGGGGALPLAAGVRIDVTGIVIAAGCGGGRGLASLTFGAAGGGGAGGGILVEAPIVAVTGVLAANGGGGGGAAYQAQGAGATGTSGQPNGTPAPGGEGGSSNDPTIGAGGAGGAGTTGAEPGHAGGGGSPNGGGGGGGVGRIAVYSRSGAAPGGTCSPPPAAASLAPK
ncbi:MAG: hypothetical protein HY906_22150 [Deltaproteobacteria bacterium]|nr:hypothetical protein [Deltaproteobacteria bacterium]